MQQYLQEFASETAVEVSRVPGRRVRDRPWSVPWVLSRGALVERHTECEEVPVGLLLRGHLLADLHVRRNVTSRAAGPRFVVIGVHRDVEVDDAHSSIGPEQVRGLDVAVENTILVQVREAGERFHAEQLHVIGRERLAFQQVIHHGSRDVLEHHERRVIRQLVRPHHAHDVRMRRESLQDAVLPLESLERRATVLHDELEDAARVRERVEHAIHHRESALSELLLDAEPVREVVTAVQRGVVDLRATGRGDEAVRGLDRARLARVRPDDLVEACECNGGVCRSILGVECTKSLQPLVELDRQLGFQLGRLHREDGVLVHHVVDGGPCRLAHQQLVEDEPGRIEVRRHARLGRVLVALGCLVDRIQLVDDRFRDGAELALSRPRVVEAAEKRAAGFADEHRVRCQVAVHDLRLTAMRVIEGGQHVAHDRDLLVEGERQRCLRDVLSQRMTGHVLRDQHEPTLVLVRKEITNRQDVRMTGQRRHRPEGVLDASPFGPAICIGEVRIDRIHPQPRTADLPGAAAARFVRSRCLTGVLIASQSFCRLGCPSNGGHDYGKHHSP